LQGEFGEVIQAGWKRYEKENPVKVAIRRIKKATYDKVCNLKLPRV